MTRLSSLSIFFPCLNDGKILPELVAKTYRMAPDVAKRFEVIIIENGSTDDTPRILTRLERKYPLRVLRFKKPLGYGGALRQGFAHAKNDWVFYTDGDGQYDPSELVTLVQKLEPGTSVVNGYKLGRSDNLLRRLAGSLYNRLLHRIYPLPIRDIDCDFRLIKRSLLRNVRLRSTSGAVCTELVIGLKNAGARFTEAGVSHYPRPFGRSQFFRVTHLVDTLGDHLRFFLLAKPQKHSILKS